MKNTLKALRRSVVQLAIACALAPMVAVAQGRANATATAVPPMTFTWATVANSATAIPGGAGRLFNSFNQPSVNSAGVVALRGRSKGGDSQPLRGIYARPMKDATSALAVVLDTMTTVPGPNNTSYGGQFGTLTEFPAFPRIGLSNPTIASRGQSKPVWTYLLPDGTETRTGTSGIYAVRQGERLAAMTQLGGVAGFEHFSVPGAPAGTRFDQFPGAPAVAHANAVVFKGNYTDGVPKTGIFFRNFGPAAAPASTQVIASSNTLIPGQPIGGARFGSTAPPSASDKDVVFLGLDNEENPTLGGIYRAPLAATPLLQTLVTIGAAVPGEPVDQDHVFNRLGEALSYDGRYVAFWGAWGTLTRTVHLTCPTDGQSAVIGFCIDRYPTGVDVQVPVNQGIFLHDTQARKTFPVAKTGGQFMDFVSWTFSGRPPGVGDADSEDFEEPRWRSSAFVATSGQGGTAQVAFKGRRPTSPALTDGIYLTEAPKTPAVFTTVVETGMDGAMVDPQAAGVPIIAVGLERDGLRAGWLAIAASMANEVTGWAGVYVTRTSK